MPENWPTTTTGPPEILGNFANTYIDLSINANTHRFSFCHRYMLIWWSLIWLIYDGFVTGIWLWLIHDWYMAYTWLIHGWCMTDTWLMHELDENGWKGMKVDLSGWKWIKMDEECTIVPRTVMFEIWLNLALIVWRCFKDCLPTIGLICFKILGQTKKWDLPVLGFL